MDRRAVLRRAAERLGRDESFQEQFVKFGSSPNSKALAHSGCRRLYWNKVSYYVDRDRNSEFRESEAVPWGKEGEERTFPRLATASGPRAAALARPAPRPAPPPQIPRGHL